MSSPRSLRTSPAIRLLGVLFLAGCGGRGEEVSGAALQDTTGAPANGAAQQQEEGFDLAAMGFDEGSAETAVLGIVEFSDFGCGHCANFHTESYAALHDEFVETGETVWKYIPVSIGGFPNGDLAGVVGVCSLDSPSFPRLRDRIFERRDEWFDASPAEAAELLVGYATDSGISAAPLRACVASAEAMATLNSHNQTFRQLGATGTPTFFVGGAMVSGAPSLIDFQGALRRILAEIHQGSAGGSPTP